MFVLFEFTAGNRSGFWKNPSWFLIFDSAEVQRAVIRPRRPIKMVGGVLCRLIALTSLAASTFNTITVRATPTSVKQKKMKKNSHTHTLSLSPSSWPTTRRWRSARPVSWNRRACCSASRRRAPASRTRPRLSSRSPRGAASSTRPAPRLSSTLGPRVGASRTCPSFR